MNRKDLFNPYTGKEKYIFISYHHGDSEKVYDIITAFHHKGYRIWHDKGIPMGDAFFDELSERLSNSSVVFCFLTPAYLELPYCRMELQSALSHGLPVIPIMLTDDQIPESIKLALSSINLIYFSWFDSAEEFVDQLSEKAAKYLDPCREANTDQTTPEQLKKTDDEKHPSEKHSAWKRFFHH